MKQSVKIFTFISLLIFLYLVIYHFYKGILHPIPSLGDSWDYHIPISKSILNGSFLNPSNFTTEQYFAQLNPGSSEAINSVLMLLNIPLTVSNIVAIIALFFSCFVLARKFHLEYYSSFLFAATICTFTAITRWFNAVSIDVWLAAFFVLEIALLEKPQKTHQSFFLLGIVSGMLIGSKYSAWSFIFILFIIYGKSLLKKITVSKFVIFFIPFSVLGLFWYVRNYLAVGNPVWPVCLLSLPCKAYVYNNHLQMWNASIKYPITMFNALFSEYKLWSLALFLLFFVLYFKFKRKFSFPRGIWLLCFIGLANLLFSSLFPTSPEPWVMVSSFRYSYPIFIPLVLSLFLLTAYLKKEVLLGYFIIANMLPTLSLEYLPKLIFFYFPLALVCFYFIKRFEPND